MPRSVSLRLLLRTTLAGLLLLGASCSGRKAVYSVTGKVLFEGRPAVGAVVQFHPLDKAEKDRLAPLGEVGADGTFQLTTYAQGDGAPAGRYAVTVSWGVPSKSGDGMDRLLVPARYLSPATSKLTAEAPTQAVELPPFKLNR
jgi:hypothetical protein